MLRRIERELQLRPASLGRHRTRRDRQHNISQRGRVEEELQLRSAVLRRQPRKPIDAVPRHAVLLQERLRLDLGPAEEEAQLAEALGVQRLQRHVEQSHQRLLDGLDVVQPIRGQAVLAHALDVLGLVDHAGGLAGHHEVLDAAADPRLGAGTAAAHQVHDPDVCHAVRILIGGGQVLALDDLGEVVAAAEAQYPLHGRLYERDAPGRVSFVQQLGYHRFHGSARHGQCVSADDLHALGQDLAGLLGIVHADADVSLLAVQHQGAQELLHLEHDVRALPAILQLLRHRTGQLLPDPEEFVGRGRGVPLRQEHETGIGVPVDHPTPLHRGLDGLLGVVDDVTPRPGRGAGDLHARDQPPRRAAGAVDGIGGDLERELLGVEQGVLEARGRGHPLADPLALDQQRLQDLRQDPASDARGDEAVGGVGHGRLLHEEVGALGAQEGVGAQVEGPHDARIQARKIEGDDGGAVEARDRLHHGGSLVPVVAVSLRVLDQILLGLRLFHELRVDSDLLTPKVDVLRRGAGDLAHLQDARDGLELFEDLQHEAAILHAVRGHLPATRGASLRKLPEHHLGGQVMLGVLEVVFGDRVQLQVGQVGGVGSLQVKPQVQIDAPRQPREAERVVPHGGAGDLGLRHRARQVPDARQRGQLCLEVQQARPRPEVAPVELRDVVADEHVRVGSPQFAAEGDEQRALVLARHHAVTVRVALRGLVGFAEAQGHGVRTRIRREERLRVDADGDDGILREVRVREGPGRGEALDVEGGHAQGRHRRRAPRRLQLQGLDLEARVDADARGGAAQARLRDSDPARGFEAGVEKDRGVRRDGRLRRRLGDAVVAVLPPEPVDVGGDDRDQGLRRHAHLQPRQFEGFGAITGVRDPSVGGVPPHDGHRSPLGREIRAQQALQVVLDPLGPGGRAGELPIHGHARVADHHADALSVGGASPEPDKKHAPLILHRGASFQLPEVRAPVAPGNVILPEGGEHLRVATREMRRVGI